MTQPMLMVFALACGGLVLASIGGLLALQVRKGRQKFENRVANFATPYARAERTIDAPGKGGKRARKGPGLSKQLAGLFGFDPARTEAHTMRWQYALAAALVLGLLVGRIASNFFGPFGGALALPAWVGLGRFYFASCERRRSGKLFAQFPDALGMIVRSVRAGIPVTEAVRIVARESPTPTEAEFAKLSDQIAIGMSLETALRDMAERNNLPEYRFFATALSLQAQTGGGLSETLEGLADVIRKRIALKLRGNALASEAKTSMYILAGLPIVTMLGLMVINREYAGILLFDPTGQKILAIAITSLGMGMFVMRTTIRKSLS